MNSTTSLTCTPSTPPHGGKAAPIKVSSCPKHIDKEVLMASNAGLAMLMQVTTCAKFHSLRLQSMDGGLDVARSSLGGGCE